MSEDTKQLFIVMLIIGVVGILGIGLVAYEEHNEDRQKGRQWESCIAHHQPLECEKAIGE